MIDTVQSGSYGIWNEPDFKESRQESPEVCIKSIARIASRIEARIPGRIRGLSVSSSGRAIVLSGTCHTYYSKQMAQHTARGLMEHDRLINKIRVLPPK